MLREQAERLESALEAEKTKPSIGSQTQAKNRRQLQEEQHLKLWQEDRQTSELLEQFGTEHNDQILDQKCRAWC